MTDYEKIEQFLKNEMLPDEHAAFVKQIEVDATLAEDVELYRNILNSLKNNAAAKEGKAAFLQTLGNNKQKITAQPTQAKAIKFYESKVFVIGAIAVAASILAFILLSPVFNKTSNVQDLYAQYAIHETISPATRATNTDSTEAQKNYDSLFAVMQSFYNNKQYSKALPLLEDYTKKNVNDAEFIIATGVCYLETNQYNKADSVFKTVASTETVFKYKAIWYTALTSLKQSNIAQCKKSLQEIPAEANEYNNAQRLLKELEAKGHN